MTYSLTILHMSDLHFGDQSRFKDRTPEDTAKQCAEAVKGELQKEKASSAPDVIIVTGDLTQVADPGEFDLARRFMVTLSMAFSLARSRFVFLPGNHDVSWKACEDWFKKNKLKDGEYNPVLAATKFQAYTDFKRKFYGSDRPKDFSLDRGASITEFSSLKMCVGALNSSEAETHQKHIGVVSETQAQAMMDQLRSSDYQGCLKILAVHHPINSSPDKAQAWISRLKEAIEKKEMDTGLLQRFQSDALSLEGNDMINAVIQDGCVHAVLHGHQHSLARPQSVAWKADSGYCQICPAGSFGVNAGGLPPDQPNSMRLLHFYAQNNKLKLKTWTLEYDPLERLPGRVVRGCFRNTGRDPVIVDYDISSSPLRGLLFMTPPAGFAEEDSKADSSGFPAEIRMRINLILSENPALKKLLSMHLRVHEDVVLDHLTTKRYSGTFGALSHKLICFRICLDDLSRILLQLAAAEIHSERVNEVQSALENIHGPHLFNLKTRYPLFAELIVSAAMDKEPAFVPKKIGETVHFVGRNQISCDLESGILIEKKRQDVEEELERRKLLDPELKRKMPGLDQIPEGERMQRLENRLRAYLIEHDPLFIVHEGPSPIAINGLVEFLIPRREDIIDITAAETRENEDILLQLIHNMLDKVYGLKGRERSQ